MTRRPRRQIKSAAAPAKSLPAGPRLAFMNIPEAGGGVVERAIERLAEAEGATLCPLYGASEFDGKTYADVPGYNVYRGNLKWNFIKDLPQGYARSVILRRPFDQILSLIDFIRNSPQHPMHEDFKGKSVAQALAVSQGNHNVQTKYLLGAEDFRTILLNSERAVPERIARAVDQVRINLATFQVIGLATNLSEFASDLSAEVGLELPPLKRNEPPRIYAADRLSRADADQLAQATWVDRPVFQMIWEEFLRDKTDRRPVEA